MENKQHKKKTWKYTIISICSIIAFLLLWELCTDVLGLTKPTTLPSPVRVFNTFIIAMAWFKPVDYFVTPLFDLLRPVPGIAWLPVLIVMFGIGLLSRAMVIFLSAFIACVINSYSGIKNTKPVHLWVGQTFGASNLQQLFQIAIPTALPMIFTGLKVALGASWNALIAAELLASSKGLGFMINQARGIYRPDIIIVGMIAVGITGAIFQNSLLVFLRFSVSWHFGIGVQEKVHHFIGLCQIRPRL